LVHLWSTSVAFHEIITWSILRLYETVVFILVKDNNTKNVAHKEETYQIYAKKWRLTFDCSFLMGYYTISKSMLKKPREFQK
jgi:hypothetical protein